MGGKTSEFFLGATQRGTGQIFKTLILKPCPHFCFFVVIFPTWIFGFLLCLRPHQIYGVMMMMAQARAQPDATRTTSAVVFVLRSARASAPILANIYGRAPGGFTPGALGRVFSPQKTFSSKNSSYL